MLGLPVDALNLAESAAAIQEAAAAGTGLIFATPNLNFLRTATADAAFRDTVLATGLSLADGMPLVWLSRLLNVPLPERVAGSTLFEYLRTRAGTAAPLKVFFFGGEPGAAEQARDNVNLGGGGLVAVGALSPGFGSIPEMSEPAVIDAINDSGAQFLVVALGAQKGHAWIEYNRARLQPMVISHLGAVVNFAAGSLARAPCILQVAGLEWLWRLVHEPRLLSRYAGDAVYLLREFALAALPLAFMRETAGANGGLRIASTPSGPDGQALRLTGALDRHTAPKLSQALAEAEAGGAPVTQISIDQLVWIDSRGLGALYEARWRRSPAARIALETPNPKLLRLLELNRALCLLSPRGDSDPCG